MKIKKDFVLRNIAGEIILIPTGTTTQDFNGLITLNEVAAFIWNSIENVGDEREIIDKVLEEYDVDLETATNDVERFIGVLKKYDMIE